MIIKQWMSSSEKLRTSARLQKIKDKTDLAKTIKTLTPLNKDVLSEKVLPTKKETEEVKKEDSVTMAATKEEIAEMLRKQRTRKAFELEHFSGKSSDNAKEFLASFENYSKLNNIPDSEKILTFEMCLLGTAKVWFLTLPEETKKNFKMISELFQKDYVQNNQWLNTTRLENRKLRIGETAEHYITDMSNLALLTGIKDEELGKALIRGLPDQLRWHVISFNPTTLSDTIQRILLGEATLAFTKKEEIHAIEDNELAMLMKTMELRMEKLEEVLKTRPSDKDDFSHQRSKSLPRQFDNCDGWSKMGQRENDYYYNESWNQARARSQRPLYQHRSDRGSRNGGRYYDSQSMRPNRVRFDTRYDNPYNSRQYRSYKPGYNYSKNMSTPRM